MYNLAQQSGRSGSAVIFSAIGKGAKSLIIDMTFLTKTPKS